MTEDEKLAVVAAVRESAGNEAAKREWFRLGLPIVPAMIEPSEANDNDA